jgi:hypothetical protein
VEHGRHRPHHRKLSHVFLRAAVQHLLRFFVN